MYGSPSFSSLARFPSFFSRIQEKEGIEETVEEKQAQQDKEDAAMIYDTFDMRVDRHWSDKKVRLMHLVTSYCLELPFYPSCFALYLCTPA